MLLNLEPISQSFWKLGGYRESVTSY